MHYGTKIKVASVYLNQHQSFQMLLLQFFIAYVKLLIYNYTLTCNRTYVRI